MLHKANIEQHTNSCCFLAASIVFYSIIFHGSKNKVNQTLVSPSTHLANGDITLSSVSAIVITNAIQPSFFSNNLTFLRLRRTNFASFKIKLSKNFGS